MTRIALLIDAENIGADHFSAIIDHAGKFGQIGVKRLFGLSPGWEQIARKDALKVEWQASGGKGKNTVDIAMTIHAMDIVHRKLADAICLVSSDCDFQPLAIHLREAGIAVYGIGEEKTDKSLRNAYVDFQVLPSKKPDATPVETTPSKQSTPSADWSRDDAILELMPQGHAWIRLNDLGTELRRHPEISKSLKKGRLAEQLRAMPSLEERGSGSEIEFRRRPEKPKLAVAHP